MGYRGTTELSSVANPPRVMNPGMWGSRTTSVAGTTSIQGRQCWFYCTTDGTTEMISTSYFSDAQDLGMVEGDMVMGVVDTGSSVHAFQGVIGAVTTDGAGINSTNAYISSTR